MRPTFDGDTAILVFLHWCQTSGTGARHESPVPDLNSKNKTVVGIAINSSLARVPDF
ncbi:hypothetical protein [Phoenicibacter congonensis]|uniref:hypothetical protein n=1 Tax=Phoenicibacter congonensis TaxID=1944646 RepID=UPI0012FF9F5B|nr:hypothetical protein [Phoenicibacter congonensis]